MNITGLDYNTQREKLVLSEYGREIQKMAEHACTLPTKEERQRCAETIIGVMERMVPQNRETPNYKEKLWGHLALMAKGQLDIDWPVNIEELAEIATKPEPLTYPAAKIPVKHYGEMLFKVFEQLKTMEPGEKRDELVRQTANQMKRNLLQWSHGSCDEEKIADDLARYTDGRIQLDLKTFKFERINERDFQQAQQNTGKKKKK